MCTTESEPVSVGWHVEQSAMVPYGYGKRKEWLEISARSGGVTLWRTSGLLTKWRARMMVLESEKYRERDGNIVGAIVFGYVI